MAMRRRDFIAGIAGASATVWPRATSAQRRTGSPVIGYLDSTTEKRKPESYGERKGGEAIGY
jgi:hypothetical protein